MDERNRRKDLAEQYRETATEAGVYRIRTGGSTRGLLGSAANLASVRNKVAFAKSTNTPGALDHRLGPDIQAHGITALEFEVLESFVPAANTSKADIANDLRTLESLWRERLGDDVF